MLLPLYTRVLTPADYGSLDIVDLTIQTATFLLAIGLSGDALFYFYSRAKSVTEQASVVWTMFGVCSALAILCACTGIAAAPLLSSYLFGTTDKTTLLRAGFAVLAVSIPGEVLLAHLRAVDKAGLFSILVVVRLLLNIALNLLFLLLFKFGAVSMLLSSLVASVPVFLVALRATVLSLRPVWPDLSMLRGIAVFSYPLGITAILLMAINFGDRYVLVAHVTVAELGIYGLAYKCGMLVGYVSMSFQLFWRSQVHNILKEEDGDALFVRLLTGLSLVYGIVTIASVLLARPFFVLVAGPAFRQAEVYLPLISLAYSLRAIEYQLQSLFLASAKTHEVLRSTVLGFVVGVGGYFLLIPRYRVWGAIAATIAAFSSMLLLTYYRGVRIRPLSLEASKLLSIVVTTILVVAVKVFAEPVIGYPLSIILCIVLTFVGIAVNPLLSSEMALLASFVRIILEKVLRPRTPTQAESAL